MDHELVTTRQDLLSLRGEWDALWMHSHGDYYTSFASCLAALDEVHAPAGHALRCAIARDDGRLVAVLPMALKRKGLWRVAVTLGPDAAEGCDIVVAEGEPAGTALALLRFFLRRGGADVLDLPFLRGGNALDRAVEACGAFRTVTQSDVMPYARLSAEADWPRYERSLSRQTQAQTARKRRRLEEAGAVKVELTHGAADAAIDWLLDEKATWGRKTGKTGAWLFAPGYRAYLKSLAAEPGGGQRLATFVLRVDGRIAAVKVIAVGTTLATLIIAAYDEALRKFSPGNILDEVWVRHVFDTARDGEGRPLDINFGNGVERYKLHWGGGTAFPSRTCKLAATRWGELPYRLKAALAGAKARLSPPHAEPLAAAGEELG